MSNQPRRRGPMGGGHGRMGTGEKAKDFKGTMKKLFTYLSEYKIGIFFVMIFAIGSTVFNIIGQRFSEKRRPKFSKVWSEKYLAAAELILQRLVKSC